MEMSGLGSNSLRRIPVSSDFQMDIVALERAIAQDSADGFTPFMIVGTAGTVDTGAVDDLQALARLAQRESLWLHVDGAYGALGMLAPDVAPRLKGIELADSIAFDFHKWGQVPYDAGFLLVRDGTHHEQAFASPAAYLQREARGLAADSPWPCDFSPDLSRGFRALKTWFTFKVYGAQHIGRTIARTCEVARYMQDRIALHRELELLAPVALNIVCFRFRCPNADQVNRDIVADLHVAGIAAPSTTTINGHLAIRAAIVNHRTGPEDIDTLLSAVVAAGTARHHQQN
jgi:glutamate/tyrosine decarboxylase-like PLP-dependent enzyme